MNTKVSLPDYQGEHLTISVYLNPQRAIRNSLQRMGMPTQFRIAYPQDTRREIPDRKTSRYALLGLTDAMRANTLQFADVTVFPFQGRKPVASVRFRIIPRPDRRSENPSPVRRPRFKSNYDHVEQNGKNFVVESINYQTKPFAQQSMKFSLAAVPADRQMLESNAAKLTNCLNCGSSWLRQETCSCPPDNAADETIVEAYLTQEPAFRRNRFTARGLSPWNQGWLTATAWDNSTKDAPDWNSIASALSRVEDWESNQYRRRSFMLNPAIPVEEAEWDYTPEPSTEGETEAEPTPETEAADELAWLDDDTSEPEKDATAASPDTDLPRFVAMTPGWYETLYQVCNGADEATLTFISKTMNAGADRLAQSLERIALSQWLRRQTSAATPWNENAPYAVGDAEQVVEFRNEALKALAAADVPCPENDSEYAIEYLVKAARKYPGVKSLNGKAQAQQALQALPPAYWALCDNAVPIRRSQDPDGDVVARYNPGELAGAMLSVARNREEGWLTSLEEHAEGPQADRRNKDRRTGLNRDDVLYAVTQGRFARWEKEGYVRRDYQVVQELASDEYLYQEALSRLTPPETVALSNMDEDNETATMWHPHLGQNPRMYLIEEVLPDWERDLYGVTRRIRLAWTYRSTNSKGELQVRKDTGEITGAWDLYLFRYWFEHPEAA